MSRTVAAGCVVVLLAVTAHAAAGAPLRQWLVCGAVPGQAGIASLGVDAEAHLRPSAADTATVSSMDQAFHCVWRPLASPTDRVDLESEAAFGGHFDFGWPRGCAYASVYLATPAPRGVRLRLSTVHRALAWLDREPVVDGRTMTLGPQPRRLLVKVIAPRVDDPSFGKGWWFEAGVTTPDGGEVDGLQVLLDDPERARDEVSPQPGATLGQLTDMAVLPARPRCTFLPTEDVSLQLRLSLVAPDERQKRFGVNHSAFDTADNEAVLDWEALDDESRAVGAAGVQVRYSLGRPAAVDVRLGRLPVGFYTVWPVLRTPAGKTVRHLEPVGIAVVRGPARGGEYPRKLASAFYWLASLDFREYVPWLARVGLNRNLGACDSWWTEGYQADTGKYRPEFDALLALARAEQVDIVGYLDAGFPAEMNPKLKLSPKQMFIWFWTPLPEWDSAEYERLVRQYVFNTVSRYKDRIHAWKSYNELDLTPLKPEVYTRAATLMREEIRRADPQATFVGASFCREASGLFEKLVESGAVACHDVVDVHTYPLAGPPFSADLDGWGAGGVDAYTAVLERHGLSKPFWWGEIGARRSYPVFAAHADDFSLARPDGTATPAICAMNAAAHLLDGKRFAGTLALPGLQAGRFQGGGEEVVVLWGSGAARLRVTGRAEQFDALGRGRPLAAQGGVVRVEPGGHVTFVRAETVAAATG
ncbi:MAG: hypothetical protein HYU66_02820 [Armatimonadetes bacterium]|nr:hypothetical protein [Armatimonadota bacterium]